jgi:hypothetical protein
MKYFLKSSGRWISGCTYLSHENQQRVKGHPENGSINTTSAKAFFQRCFYGQDASPSHQLPGWLSVTRHAGQNGYFNLK